MVKLPCQAGFGVQERKGRSRACSTASKPGQLLSFKVNVYTWEAHTGTQSNVRCGQGSWPFLGD